MIQRLTFPSVSVAATIFGFGAAAAISRALLQTTQTRLQICVFIVLAMTFEAFGRRAIGQRASIPGLALNCSAIVIAMLSVKIALEGPPHVAYWIRYSKNMLG